MPDRYDNRIVKAVFGTFYAVTIGQTTYYSAPEWWVRKKPEWVRHEEKHKEQWRREGYLKFLVKYTWYHLTRGYDRNPYEIEAREAGGGHGI